MLTETIQIQVNPQKAYDAFANIRGWAEILSDVVDVEVLYDDGRHQEFRMTVSRPTGHETVRGIRFCARPHIELVQPEPPPGFRRMMGLWTIERKGTGTEVNARRSFELIDDSAASREACADKLRHYLRRNLETFKSRVEASC